MMHWVWIKIKKIYRRALFLLRRQRRFRYLFSLACGRLRSLVSSSLLSPCFLFYLSILCVCWVRELWWHWIQTDEMGHHCEFMRCCRLTRSSWINKQLGRCNCNVESAAPSLSAHFFFSLSFHSFNWIKVEMCINAVKDGRVNPNCLWLMRCFRLFVSNAEAAHSALGAGVLPRNRSEKLPALKRIHTSAIR